jgi:hypothetical protein
MESTRLACTDSTSTLEPFNWKDNYYTFSHWSKHRGSVAWLCCWFPVLCVVKNSGRLTESPRPQALKSFTSKQLMPRQIFLRGQGFAEPNNLIISKWTSLIITATSKWNFEKSSANEHKDPIYFYISCIDPKIVNFFYIVLLKELSHKMDCLNLTWKRKVKVLLPVTAKPQLV